MFENPAVFADGTVGDGCHRYPTFGHPSVVFNQGIGDLPVLAHAFKTAGTDDAVLQLKVADLFRGKDLVCLLC
jgi:hypothetical protein